MTWKKPTDDEREARYRERQRAFKSAPVAIAWNRSRAARWSRAERVLRWCRQHIFDFEDQDALDGGTRADRAQELMQTCKSILRPKWEDRKSTRLNSSHIPLSRMPSSA